MRRALMVTVIVVFGLVLVGCPQQPPGWTAPEITGIELVPLPVAGEPFVVRVTAEDEEIVNSVRILIEPTYAIDGYTPTPYQHVDCDEPPVIAGELVTVEFTCTMASFSPNGAWSVTAFASNVRSTTPQREVTTFVLTGGSEDREPPVLESLVISPSPVVRGEPYSVTMRISDEHLVVEPRTFGLRNATDVLDPDAPPGVHWPCGAAEPTILSPTEMELQWEGCVIGPEAVLGDYYSYLSIPDQIGHPLSFYARTDVVASP